MKTIQVLAGLSLATILSTAPAWAEAGHGGTKVYSSGLAVILFIGICALVVLVQMIPALVTMWGMIKSAGKSESQAKLSKVRMHS